MELNIPIIQYLPASKLSKSLSAGIYFLPGQA